MMAELANFPLIQPILGDMGLSILQLLLFFVSLWLIFLILIQRGKGGGLTAAFGGGGGESAFGAKAGDAFTRITIVTSLIWITLCMVTIARYNPPDQPVNPFAQGDQQQQQTSTLSGGASMSPAGEGEGDAAASEGEATEGDTTSGEATTESAGDAAAEDSAGEASDQ